MKESHGHDMLRVNLHEYPLILYSVFRIPGVHQGMPRDYFCLIMRKDREHVARMFQVPDDSLKRDS